MKHVSCVQWGSAVQSSQACAFTGLSNNALLIYHFIECNATSLRPSKQYQGFQRVTYVLQTMQRVEGCICNTHYVHYESCLPNLFQ